MSSNRDGKKASSATQTSAYTLNRLQNAAFSTTLETRTGPVLLRVYECSAVASSDCFTKGKYAKKGKTVLGRRESTAPSSPSTLTASTMSPPPSPTKGPISPEERVDWQRRQNAAHGALLAQEEFHLSQEAGVSETLGLDEEGLQFLVWNAGWISPSGTIKGIRNAGEVTRSGQEEDGTLAQDGAAASGEDPALHKGRKVTTYFLPHGFPDDPKWRALREFQENHRKPPFAEALHSRACPSVTIDLHFMQRRVERSGEEGDGSVMYAVTGHNGLFHDKARAMAVFKATPGAELKASCDEEELWKFLKEDMARMSVAASAKAAVTASAPQS
ncbi:hypothetical protein B0H10DRAFT_1958058 [Mycena sp. CBHHK59/15]|nr:hypothetical protein B0H10DRAFT_1958058 [Mycena sp. CBHHK59/15]